MGLRTATQALDVVFIPVKENPAMPQNNFLEKIKKPVDKKILRIYFDIKLYHVKRRSYERVENDTHE